MSESITQETKPKRNYTKKSKVVEAPPPSSARDFFKEIISELKASSEPPQPKPKNNETIMAPVNGLLLLRRGGKNDSF
jgi:hypothetical protein